MHSEKSAFQQIDILESEEFGRILTLDGLMMVTEKDEFVYHDMIVHPAMCVNPAIKKVLVIGGGDGGTVRELARYKTIEQIDMVEIDERVVRICEHFLPITSAKLKDSRVKLYFEDGINWVKHARNSEYDLIIVDSTDPIGPGKTLFSAKFYANCFRVLSENGILINQQISLCFDWDASRAKQAHAKIKRIFPIARLYQAHTPTYASGLSLFGFASKALDPIEDAKFDAWNQLGLKTGYYNTDLHIGAFAHPTYVNKILDRASVGWLKIRTNEFARWFRAFSGLIASLKNVSGYGLELWLAENWSKSTRFSVKVSKHIYRAKSAFQRIDILESREFGRFLALDGFMAVNEKDEFIYHDLLVHPAMCVNPSIKKVLVIGNGWGGAVRELARYNTIQQIDMIERDEQLVCACQQFLPGIAAKLKDSRVCLHYEDGAAWAANAKDGEYDLIIIAPDDDAELKERLSTMEFYQNCFRILSKDGILINQGEDHAKTKTVFPISTAYQAHIPTRASGHKLFGFASKALDPTEAVDFESWERLGLETKYYNVDLHIGAFMLPTHVKDMLAT